jgi:hypothetical protein
MGQKTSVFGMILVLYNVQIAHQQAALHRQSSTRLMLSPVSVTTEAFVAGITGTNLIVNCKNPTFTFEYKKDGTVLGSSPTWLTYDSVL